MAAYPRDLWRGKMLLILLLLQSFLPGQGLSSQNENTLQILPKNQAKGIDFCGVDEYSYIVRSDLGCYMRSTNFNRGANLHIFSLHRSVQGGDHYLAHKDDLFYVIKGDTYRRVTNLNSDEHAAVFHLHPNCRNGDHYFSMEDSFYIVYKKKGVYRRVTDMSKDSHAHEFHIHPDLKDGLYYWGTKSHVFIVKPISKWGVEYHRTTDLSKNANPLTQSIHGDVVNFLPGGLAMNYGKSFGVWKAVKTLENLSNVSVTWEEQISKKTGYEKTKMNSVESNWHISADAQVRSGGLVQTLLQVQLSMGVEFGGAHIYTEGETWSDSTTVSEKISLVIPPRSGAYFWQYQLGLGKEELLFSRDLAFTDVPKRPTYNPLPPPEDIKEESE